MLSPKAWPQEQRKVGWPGQMVAVVNKRRLQGWRSSRPLSPLLSSPLQPLLSSAQSLCLAFSRCIQVPTLIFLLLSYKSDTRHSDPDLALTVSRSHLVRPPIPTARASASGSSRHSKATLILSCYHLNLTATQALDFLALFFSVLHFSFRR